MFNKLLEMLNLGDNYDDYDDEIDEEEYDEDEYEEPKSKRRGLFSGKSADEFDEDEELAKPSRMAPMRKDKVVPMTSRSRGMEVCVIRPKSIEDAREITDTLRDGKAVVLNLEGIHVEVAQRIIDFSAGSSYSIDGNLQKITNYIFIITPPNVDVSGDFSDLVTGGIDLSSFNDKGTTSTLDF